MATEPRSSVEGVSGSMRLLWSPTRGQETWRYAINPRVISDEGSFLYLSTDSGQAPARPGWSPVDVEVIAAGGQSTPGGEMEKTLHVIASGVFDQRWRLRKELVVTQ
jgi:hypothetical protein